jgi:hypothetical protein
MSGPSVAYFDSEAGYVKAIDTVIVAAQRQVCIFDGDLARLHLERPARVMTLSRFLAGSRTARLRLLLHDTARLEGHLPRLLRLLADYPHAVEVRRTDDEFRHLADRILLADEAYAVVRFHVSRARGKLVFDDSSETAALRERFESLWQRSSPAAVTTPLGL